jgi:hypothetical protein
MCVFVRVVCEIERLCVNMYERVFTRVYVVCRRERELVLVYVCVSESVCVCGV